MEGWKEAEEGRKEGSQQKREDGSRGRREVSKRGMKKETNITIKKEKKNSWMEAKDGLSKNAVSKWKYRVLSRTALYCAYPMYRLRVP